MERFFKKFKQLCDQENISPNAVAKELGISSGSVTAWKQGRTPKMGTVEQIANRFNVDIQVFFMVDSINEKE